MKGTDGTTAAADRVNNQPPPSYIINKHCVETINCGLSDAERLLINNKGRKFKIKKGTPNKIVTFKSLEGIELSFISGALATCIVFTSFFMYNILGRLLTIN